MSSGKLLGWLRSPWVTLGLCWLLFALIEFLTHTSWSRGAGQTIGWGSLLAAAVPGATLWTAAVWSAFRLAIRQPIGRSAGWLAIGAHGGLALVVVSLDTLLTIATAGWLGVDRGEGGLRHLLTTLVLYCLFIGAAHGVVYARRYRQKQLAELQLRADLARTELERTRSELRMLRMELKPDFLFSSLTTIRDLVRVDPPAAGRVLLDLSDLLRQGLTADGSPVATLAEELGSLQSFLRIEQERLRSDLVLSVEIDDRLLEEPVPPMILVPLAEAVMERLAERRDGCAVLITVRAAARGADLALEVELAGGDAGPGGPDDHRLRHVEQRLRGPHAEVSSVTIESTAGGGAIVRALLPMDPQGDSLSRGSRGGGTEPVVACAQDASNPSVAAIPGSLARISRRTAVWLGLTVWFALHTLLGYPAWVGMPLARGGEIPPALALALSGHGAALMTLLLLAAFWLTKRFPLVTPRWTRHLAVLLSAGLLLGTAVWLSRIAVLVVVDYVPTSTPTEGAIQAIARTFPFYFLLLGAAHAAEYARRYRRTELDELRLRERVTRAALERTRSELRALKMELNPHFLFNMLHAIHALLEEDLGAAEAMLAHLVDLLHHALAHAETQQVTLDEELAGLRTFLEIQRLRFGEALEIEISLDEDLLGVQVPHMILQPLVENAIKHGLAPRGGHGRLEIGARRSGSRLELHVRDDGIGLGTSGAAGTGIGLVNTRGRLRELYGPAAGIDLRAASGGGTLARLVLPIGPEREAPPIPSAAMVP